MKKRYIPIQIDTFSNSIFHKKENKEYQTTLLPVTPDDLSGETEGWNFNWVKEASDYQVYKLVAIEKPNMIQGLISVEKQGGFYFVSLIENAPFNIGKDKEYSGVATNLFAFICKLSKENGFEGFVVFEAKTALIEHYKSTLGAQTVGNSIRMFIDEAQAEKLIAIHF